MSRFCKQSKLTCSVVALTVLEVGDGVFEVLSTSGDTHLGGDDFDKVRASSRPLLWLANLKLNLCLLNFLGRMCAENCGLASRRLQEG